MATILKNILITKKIDKHSLFFFIILLFSFLIPVISINYNSAFNDEAIYIVIGRMGLFANDWWSYGAKLWMAGVPYIYPPLSAMAYQFGGIIGSRFLNVIFGVLLVEEVYRFTKLINLYDEKTNKLASLIAAFLAAFSGIGIFVSKLATYDMPSFLLLMLGINSFLKAKNFTNGKYYFLSFFCIFMAFLTKIVIAVFFPILFVLSVFILKARDLKHRKAAITYLYLPLILGGLFYLFLYRDNLMTYIITHKDLGKAGNYMDLLSLIWEETKILLLLFIPVAFMILSSKRFKGFISLTLLSLAIPLFHLSLLRFATLDKHLYLTVIFLSVLTGYGISLAILNKNKLLSKVTKSVLPFLIILYLYSSSQVLTRREFEWRNTYVLQNYFKEKIQPGDKVLTEEGGSVILALYDKIFPPTSIVTFDWIDYSGLQNSKGYLQAVSDVYFDYIQLDNIKHDDNPLNREIRKALVSNYSLSYKNDNFEVYEKRKN